MSVCVYAHGLVSDKGVSGNVMEVDVHVSLSRLPP